MIVYRYMQSHQVTPVDKFGLSSQKFSEMARAENERLNVSTPLEFVPSAQALVSKASCFRNLKHHVHLMLTLAISGSNVRQDRAGGGNQLVTTETM